MNSKAVKVGLHLLERVEAHLQGWANCQIALKEKVEHIMELSPTDPMLQYLFVLFHHRLFDALPRD